MRTNTTIGEIFNAFPDAIPSELKNITSDYKGIRVKRINCFEKS
jgi:hypothetical protein